MRFIVVARGQPEPAIDSPMVGVLRSNNWDDFGFKTLFALKVYSADGKWHEIGDVKIGYHGQSQGWTVEKLPQTFDVLPEGFFSLGQSPEYYLELGNIPTSGARQTILARLRDVAADSERLRAATLEKVFSDSLLRITSYSTIENQYARIASGGIALTDFDFGFLHGDLDLRFQVRPNSTPPTNLHVLVGRNGVGKTTILNAMARRVALQPDDATGRFVENYYHRKPLDPSYFSGVVSVSFSAFDPFAPPADQPDPLLGPCYFYVGLKTHATGENGLTGLKTIHELAEEFARSLSNCLSLDSKRKQWLEAVGWLESDPIFQSMSLSSLARENSTHDPLVNTYIRFSAGHAAVLLSITRLVERVEEKTLVLVDEPESHLHPPLLAAYLRALSALLRSRNAVAIIATHSPVVLQEVPKSCVWKLNRIGASTAADRPSIETFGENVGTLTREIFGLEVTKSGFHAMLASELSDKGSFDLVVKGFNNQIGMEGLAILRSLELSHIKSAGGE